MQIPQVGNHLADHLTVRPQQQTQHAMGARMLRPHVDQHFVGTNIELDNAGIFEMQSHGRNSVEKVSVSGERVDQVSDYRARMPWYSSGNS